MLHSRFVGAVLGLVFGSFGLSAVTAKEPGKYIVHEWGTFSTFSGSNGQVLKFHPNEKDLPQFVHNRAQYVKGGLTDALVSLETPVLYFYSDRDRTVSVRVNFPKGIMTDWYPETSRPPTQELRWDGLRIFAKDQLTLLGAREKSRYFAARETDAQFLQTSNLERNESEKFLFYRGVGDFKMPFEVSAHGQSKFNIKNTDKQKIPGHFLVSVQDGKVRFKSLGQMKAGAEEKVELPSESSTTEKLGDAMIALLIEQGLYEKEARAMVKTWSSAWFGQNGTRVLYLVSEAVTEELLPLQIEPKPEGQVRVLVGRHDLLTPEGEVEIDAIVKQLNGDSNSAAKEADATLQKFGRYRYAVQTAAEQRLKARAGR